jgi:hypothetical protein
MNRRIALHCAATALARVPCRVPLSLQKTAAKTRRDERRLRLDFPVDFEERGQPIRPSARLTLTIVSSSLRSPGNGALAVSGVATERAQQNISRFLPCKSALSAIVRPVELLRDGASAMRTMRLQSATTVEPPRNPARAAAPTLADALAVTRRLGLVRNSSGGHVTFTRPSPRRAIRLASFGVVERVSGVIPRARGNLSAGRPRAARRTAARSGSRGDPDPEPAALAADELHRARFGGCFCMRPCALREATTTGNRRSGLRRLAERCFCVLPLHLSTKGVFS